VISILQTDEQELNYQRELHLVLQTKVGLGNQ